MIRRFICIIIGRPDWKYLYKIVFIFALHMHYDRYETAKGETALTYEFVSRGVKGNVEKLVVYTKTKVYGTFNLGFGDKIYATEDFDDVAITNNGDSFKVMVTVAATLYPFTEKYPNAKIFVAGSTKSRTRLYRMAISNNLEMISRDFYVYGFKDHVWEEFTTGIDYDAFIVTRRKQIKNEEGNATGF